MSKCIYFNPDCEIPDGYICTWTATERAIESEDTDSVYTTQMGFLSTRLLTAGYRVFLKTKNGMIEITLGKCAGTTRYIRPQHNLFNLWKGGEWGD